MSLTPISDYGSTRGSSETSLLRKPLIKLTFKDLTPEQKGKYIKAMLYRGTNKGVQVFNDMTRSSFAILAGIQLSGILDCEIETKFNLKLFLKALFESYKASTNSRVPLTGPGISLKETFNGLLLAPVDTLTYAAAVGWVVSHTLTPPIQRHLSTKEDVLMRQILEGQNSSMEPSKLSRSQLSTTASKISHVLDYVMPLLFDASQTALLLRFIQKAGSTVFFPVNESSPTIAANDPPLYSQTGFEILNVIFNIVSGEDPVSMTVLYMLLTGGIICYATQALCNFHHDLQTKEVEYHPPISLEDPAQ